MADSPSSLVLVSSLTPINDPVLDSLVQAYDD